MKTNKPLKREIISNLAHEIKQFLDREATDDDWDRIPIAIYTPILHVSEMICTVKYLQSSQSKVKLALKSEVFRELMNRIKESKSYSDLLTSLSSMKEKSGSLIVYWLYNRIKDAPTKHNEFIDIVMGELNGTPTKWKCRLCLQGLKVAFPISTGELTIRPPNLLDFPPIQVVRGAKLPFVVERELNYNLSSVVTFELDGIHRGFAGLPELVKNINQILLRMRVSKGGSWVATAWFAETGWVTEYSNLENASFFPGRPFMLTPRQGMSPLPMMTFTPDDGTKYSELNTEVFPYLETDTKLSRKAKVALQMYSEAVQKPLEEGLLFAIIGLEALFLEHEQELRLKLAIRTGMLMELLGFDRASVYSDVSEGYKIRSKYVHGRTVGGDRIGQILPRILEYLRLSILVWLEAKHDSRTMNDVYAALENAAMDQTALDFVKEKMKAPIERNRLNSRK